MFQETYYMCHLTGDLNGFILGLNQEFYYEYCEKSC